MDPKKRGRFIVGPAYDHLLFIWPPLMFLAFGAFIDLAGLAKVHSTILGQDLPVFPILAVAFTTAHVLAVFFRSHLNGAVRREYPVRFFVVPIALLLFMNVSSRFLAMMAIYLVWFDVWHSSMQTFGLGRIYDARIGNPPTVGRGLDMGLALFTYAGPILGGVTLYTQFERFAWFKYSSYERLADVPIWTIRNQSTLSTILVVAGTLYVVFYLFAYARLVRRGYEVSKEKVMLYASLTITSVWSWGFDSFGQSYLIMESFHALQYFGLIAWSEKKNLTSVFRLTSVPHGGALAIAIVVVTCLVGGFWAAAFAHGTLAYSFILLATFCHFWWDGFIWSVRKKSHFLHAPLVASRGET